MIINFPLPTIKKNPDSMEFLPNLYTYANPREWRPEITVGDKKIGCPNCQNGIIKQKTNHWKGQCYNCKFIFNFFQPFPFQMLTIMCSNKIIIDVGGQGSAKTVKNAYKHVLQCERARGMVVAVMAPTEDMRNKYIRPEIDRFILDCEIEKATQSEIIWKNGSKIMFIVGDDPEKLKSGSFTHIWIPEFSGVHPGFVRNAPARIRNNAAKVFDLDENGDIKFSKDPGSENLRALILYDRAQVTLETNPVPKPHVREAIFTAHTLVATETVDVQKYKSWVMPKVAPDGSVLDAVAFLSATEDNPILSPSQITTMKAQNTAAWINQNMYCDLTFEDGLVFKDSLKNYINPFTIPDTWKFIEAYDQGGANENQTNDPSAYLLGAVDPHTDTLYLIDEYYAAGTLAKDDIAGILEIRRRWGVTDKRLIISLSDPTVSKMSKTERGASVKKDFHDAGIVLTTNFSRAIEEGIKKVREYFTSDRLKIFNTLRSMNMEDRNYIWATEVQGIKLTAQLKNTPIDSYNHLQDCRRYMCMMLDQYITKGLDFSTTYELAGESTKQRTHSPYEDPNDYLDDMQWDNGGYGFL